MGATVVRRFDAPEALDIRFHEVRTKSALNHVPPGTSRVPFEWTINPYRGCTHACVYCFARPTHEYLELGAGEDFEREIIVKVNVPEVLRKELARPSWRGASIALGTNTDPYQWVEGRYKLMRGIWEVMRDFRNPCSILTKSPLVLRDLDLLQEIAAVTDVSACLSVPTLDEKAWRATEPHTPNPKARLDAVAELNRAGIPTGVLIAPLMPGVNDAPEQVQRIVEAATEANATYIGGQTLFLRGAVREIYFQWLREHRPDLVPRYEKLYAKGAYVSAADKRRIELDAGAPWALRTYPVRQRHRRPQRPPEPLQRVPRVAQGSLF
jgi:DNA repair photolyase